MMSPVRKPMTALRQRMLEDLQKAGGASDARTQTTRRP